MCLRNIMPKKERKKILDKIDRKGLTVYKVVITKLDKKHYPMYINSPMYYSESDILPYQGIMKAKIIKIGQMFGPYYNSGFHFFKTKAAALRLLKYMKHKKLEQNNKDANAVKYELLECIVKKSWISMIGTEIGFKNGNIIVIKKEIVIVAKKAIFP